MMLRSCLLLSSRHKSVRDFSGTAIDCPEPKQICSNCLPDFRTISKSWLATLMMVTLFITLPLLLFRDIGAGKRNYFLLLQCGTWRDKIKPFHGRCGGNTRALWRFDSTLHVHDSNISIRLNHILSAWHVRLYFKGNSFT